jgi:molybdopterin-guanine dinucleotide biosynthesis protein A|tara:strand:+ start:13888 stop:14433 length:546 start_codon:yes stop_codon:yes gene_type:complete
MGSDKALLASVETGGVSLLGLAANALNVAGAREVVAIGRSDDSLSGQGLRVVPDRWEGEGPLGGIVTAMEAFDGSGLTHVVVLACDFIAPSAISIQMLMDAATEEPEHLVVPVVNGQYEWLHACWPLSLRQQVLSAFNRGVRAPRDLASEVPVRQVNGIDPESTRDVDTPDDLPWTVPDGN